jgi:hypothetical protein
LCDYYKIPTKKRPDGERNREAELNPNSKALAFLIEYGSIRFKIGNFAGSSGTGV